MFYLKGGFSFLGISLLLKFGVKQVDKDYIFMVKIGSDELKNISL